MHACMLLSQNLRFAGRAVLTFGGCSSNFRVLLYVCTYSQEHFLSNFVLNFKHKQHQLR